MKTTKKDQVVMLTEEETAMQKEQFVLAGTAHYAHVHKPNQFGKYTLELTVDSVTAQKLKGKNISVKGARENEETGEVTIPGPRVTLQSQFAPKVIDAKKQQVPANILIGNGSKVKVATHIFSWKKMGRAGSSLGLDEVQVLNLISYNAPNTSELLAEEDGFTVNANDDENSGDY